MSNQQNVTHTKTRVYWTEENGSGLFLACYRPKNPKNGRPWQASRDIRGYNVHRVSNYKTGEFEIRDGRAPKGWPEDGKWTGACDGFRTEADALEAIAYEKQLSKK